MLERGLHVGGFAHAGGHLPFDEQAVIVFLGDVDARDGHGPVMVEEHLGLAVAAQGGFEGALDDGVAVGIDAAEHAGVAGVAAGAAFGLGQLYVTERQVLAQEH